MIKKLRMSLGFMMVVCLTLYFPGEISAQNVEVLLEEGKSAFEEGLYTRAFERFHAVSLQVPDQEVAYDYLARIYLKQGNLEKAYDVLQTALSNSPKNAEILATLTLYYQQSGDWMKGLESAKRSLALDSNSARAHFFYGKLLFDQGLTEDAIESFERTLEINATFKEAYAYLGEAYGELGDREKEIEYYLESMQTEVVPSDTLMLNLGRAYEHHGENEKAEEIYEDLLDRASPSAEAALRLGKFEEAKGNTKKAISFYKKAIEEKELLEAYRAVAPLVLLQRKYQDFAVSVFKKLTELEPLEDEHFTQLGYLYQLSKNYESAKLAYQQALDLDPDASVNDYNLGVVSQELKEWEMAIDHFKIAIEKNGKDADYFVSLATAYCESQQNQHAHEILAEGQALLDVSRSNSVRKYLNRKCPIGT